MGGGNVSKERVRNLGNVEMVRLGRGGGHDRKIKKRDTIIFGWCAGGNNRRGCGEKKKVQR